LCWENPKKEAEYFLGICIPLLTQPLYYTTSPVFGFENLILIAEKPQWELWGGRVECSKKTCKLVASCVRTSLLFLYENVKVDREDKKPREIFQENKIIIGEHRRRCGVVHSHAVVIHTFTCLKTLKGAWLITPINFTFPFYVHFYHFLPTYQSTHIHTHALVHHSLWNIEKCSE